MNSLFWIFFILTVLANACVTLLNFKLCSNPSHRQGNVKIKKLQKHQCYAWANSRLAHLSLVVFQHLVILHHPYPLSCQLYFVYLAVFQLGILLDSD